MTRRHATRYLVLDYLRRVKAERQVSRICQYMWTMHQVSPHATRTALYRLAKDGEVERVEVGYYRHKESIDE
jgi:predicted transcriptional regulator of viral defense system